MEELPHFLRESRRFADHFPWFDFGDFHNRLLREGSTWRDIELSTSSLSDLLAIEGASEVFFAFFAGRTHKVVVWLSNDIFLTNECPIEEEEEETQFPIDQLFYFDYASLTFSPDRNVTSQGFVYFYSTAPNTTPTTVITEQVDALLRLLAQDKELNEVSFSDYMNEEERTIQNFPASLEALKDFVREATSKRDVSMLLASLSVEQWRVLSSNCNDNVSFSFIGDFHENWENAAFPLIQAMETHQCPTKLTFDGCGGFESPLISEPTFPAFAAALSVNQNLTYLLLDLDGVPSEGLASLFGAFSLNRGLRRLVLKKSDALSESQYENLWNVALGSHPAIQTLRLNSIGPRSEAGDQILVRAMRSNTVLKELDYRRAVQNQQAVEEQVRPILELNRFRPLVQAIKQEPDETLRMRQFVTTLQSDHVCDTPSFSYLLMNENSDLLVQLSRIEDVIQCGRELVVSVEHSCGKRKRS